MTAVRTEVLRQGLEAAAEEMGVVLERAAFSANIKERRDHSCAVFTPAGEVLAQAEHIPVHLGAMPATVRAVLAAYGSLAPGDAVLVNDPAHGGTHLPDLTLVAPVHVEHALVAWVAARAHHADIGGISPGSMPARSRTLEEEGLVLPPTLAVRGGQWVHDVRELVRANTRAPDERDGDLVAQHGALVVGARRVKALVRRWGQTPFEASTADLLDHTHRLVCARLAAARTGTYEAEAIMEADGTGHGPLTLRVRAELTRVRLTLDYAGTAVQAPSNLNAPIPVTYAGALYVMRVLLGADLPANAGFERALEVRVPEGTVLNPRPGAAVAAGNVEASQRNVDLVFDALAPAFPERAPAQSQGTMNNVTLGSSRPGGFTYYETLGGGEGATPARDGASGIHTHMTNTRNTPIESLEHAFPLRVVALTLRRGTGGQGSYRGGDGLVRVLEALEDGIEVNLLTSRRVRAPRGMAGGLDGATGRNRVVRADGSVETLAGFATTVLDRGDRLWVETPGGAGWGQPDG